LNNIDNLGLSQELLPNFVLLQDSIES